MALKITTQIGTDKGITSEAYVRIADYQISKYGSANFRIELFQSQDDVTPSGSYPAIGGGTARNQQIGESLYVALTQQVEETITVRRMVPVQVEVEEEVPGVPDADGNPTTTTVTRTRTEMQEQDVEETITKTVPDLSSAEGVDVFAFGYSHLKTKLEGLFGADNVVDC
jgi:esterase/lipase superfamily enzyme